MTVVDLFAGPGGWDVGARQHGIDPIGIEFDKAACLTRAAADLLTIRADVAQYPVEPFVGRLEGLIASPPCQDYSLAGKRLGRSGERGRLIDEVPRWVESTMPRWVACEQVPPCRPIWNEHAQFYESLGYRTWVGVLNAADYGVPQTRKRAILLAHLDRPVGPPAPTHTKDSGGLALLPGWISMAEALDWPPDYQGMVEIQAHGARRRRDEPAPTVTGSLDNGNMKIVRHWAWDRPATTVVGSFNPEVIAAPGYRTKVSRQDAEGSVVVSIEDRLALQTFPRDYPLRGSKSKQSEQVGNAIPPLLAQHVLGAVVTPST